MANNVSISNKEVIKELLPFLRVYKDGSVERLLNSPFVASTIDDPETGVSSKDITISQNPLISARLYLPKITTTTEKIPILVYYHGGGFCFESAFSSDHQRLLNSLVSQAKVVAVSVEYRLAPEHPLPIAYEDSWAALNWVASLSTLHNNNNNNIIHGTHDIIKEPWLSNHGDFERVFLGGDSAGANIVHNMAMRAGKEGLRGGVKILGAFLTHPYFWGSDHNNNNNSSTIDHDQVDEKTLPCLVWNFVYPSAPGGIDNPMINPISPEAPSLTGLGCSRLLVSVAEKDELRKRGVSYCEAVRKCGWKGEVELVEVQGEDHAFHILKFETEKAKNLTRRLVDFLLK